MGGYIEFNDTLQITTEQGFPRELDLEAEDFEGEFRFCVNISAGI